MKLSYKYLLFILNNLSTISYFFRIIDNKLIINLNLLENI